MEPIKPALNLVFPVVVTPGPGSRQLYQRTFREGRTKDVVEMGGFSSSHRLAFLAILLLSVGVAVATGKGSARAADYHYMGCGSAITLPRTVSIGQGVDATLVRSAMAEWNQAFGPVFVEVPAGDVTIVADTVTWVAMPCTSNKSIIHVGTDVDLNYWMAHELGHTLGLADHIRSFDNASLYINPGRCPDDAYVGIMSYCTPRALWFGPQDVQMMQTLWPELALAAPATASGVVAAAKGTGSAGLAASTAPVTTLTVRGFVPALAAGFPALASSRESEPQGVGTPTEGSALQPQLAAGEAPVAEGRPALGSPFALAADGVQPAATPTGTAAAAIGANGSGVVAGGGARAQTARTPRRRQPAKVTLQRE